MEPHLYPRRVLLFVTGLTPQIVTETLYALAVETAGRPAFVPTEVRLITTTVGAEQARLALLAPDRDQFGKLCRDYQLHGIRFDESMIEVITDNEGRPVDDIMSASQSDAAADTITRRLAELTRDDQCAVHVSLAGGRKTLSFFAGYALSLYGRSQDRLSHVLVNERFETHREFFYKPPSPVTLYDRDHLEMSTADARIRLAEIPFVPLREGLPKQLRDGAAGYAETVRAHERNLLDAELRIEPAKYRLTWHDRSVTLPPAQMAVYVWLAVRRLRDHDDAMWVLPAHLANREDKHALQQDLLETTESWFGNIEGDKACSTLQGYFSKSRTRPPSKTWLETNVSRINSKIADKLLESAVKRIGIQMEGDRGQGRYALACPPQYVRLLR